MTSNRILILVGAVLVLGAVNYSVLKKESIKREGEVVFLELAPVDPRSLMQGDYMALRFSLAEKINRQLSERLDTRDAASWIEGQFSTIAVELDSRRIAEVKTVENSANNRELKLRYRIRNGQVWVGTNAFFFEEGTASRFESAKYGEFRLDVGSGEAVLIGLRDADLKPL
jgi:uncharacterized membrane-anchored protein